MDVASKKESSNAVIEPLMISLPPLDDDSRKIPIQVDEEYVVVDPEQNSDGHTAIPVKAMQISQVSHDEQDENPYGISRYHRYHHLQQQEQLQDDSRSSTCRDPIWAVLFVLQIVVLMCLGFTWGFQSITSSDTSSPSSWISDTSEFVSDFTILLIAIFVFAALLSSVASMILSRWPGELIKGFIILKIVVLLLFSFFWVTQEKQGGFLFFLIVAVWWVFYARAVWSMIPWVASNLTTGIAAISDNLGIYLVGLGVSLMTVPFTMIWLMAVTGTEWHTTSCSTDGTCENSGFGFILALFAFSLFWTAQVLKNVLHVTVAGVVGTWWFAPQEAYSFFSRSVRDSLTRACTSSFGSICFGSFLVAVIQVLHHIVFQIRHSRLRGVSLVICLLDYILYVLQSMLEYFNKWGYVYIGLYGYSFWEAGPKVLQLFSNRGWSTIINDRLISRVLTGMSLIIGLLNGVLAEVIVALFPSSLNVEVEVEDDGVEAMIGIPFLAGSFIGFMVSHLLLSVISSALDTVLVCFAEAPMEFRQNHPLLFEQMDQAWRDKFPNEYRVVTLDAVAVSILHEPSGTLT